MTTLDRARRYLASLPRAIAGSGGHPATFAAAVALVRGFGLPEHVAFDELRAWNLTHADPPWSEADLRHKIRSAAQSDKPVGYLLGDGAGAGAPSRSTSVPDDEILRKAEARKSWPTLLPLSDTTLSEIATLRQLPLEAVHIANNAGLLAGAIIHGHRCFIIREGDYAQARRLDGGRLPTKGGGETKSKTLWGSSGHFIGRSLLGGPGETGPAGPILLVEGCIGLLEGIAAALSVDADTKGWTVLSATSAMSRFDSAWIGRIRGRRVRIVPDRDMEGMRSCGIWTASLESAGCSVDAAVLPEGIKDLGDVIANPAAHKETLRTIFEI